jgi:hypothetical protein
MRTEAPAVERWAEDFGGLLERVGPCFGRRDLRARAGGYVRGLLGRVDRKNGWQVAEYLGDEKPYGVQRLLGRASWDADAVRDEARRYAAEHLLGGGEGGVLIVDETGFLKKGDRSAGVQRQYSGTAGRIENCQVGVFLALAGAHGRALVDRELYLPDGWCQDRARCKAAGEPGGVWFATKSALALRMVDRALAAVLEPDWVLADEVYGNDSKFRSHLEGLGRPFVVAVGAQQRLWVDSRQRRVDEVAEELPASAWHRLSAGDGSKGPREYDWAAGRQRFLGTSCYHQHIPRPCPLRVHCELFVEQLESRALLSCDVIDLGYGGNGHYYGAVLRRASWTEAHDDAVARGGYLAMITSAGEQDFITQTFLTGVGREDVLWIGLTDRDTPGEFRWVTGEDFDYSNWNPGEPNSFDVGLGSEDYVAIN